jgi:hypothetical protein
MQKQCFYCRNISKTRFKITNQIQSREREPKGSRAWKCRNNGSKWKSLFKKYSKSPNIFEADRRNQKATKLENGKTMCYYLNAFNNTTQNRQTKSDQWNAIKQPQNLKMLKHYFRREMSSKKDPESSNQSKAIKCN